ncbi:imm11 family protein [Desertivirga xinjiangensis]|uniref:imm11 family protein n=1 Tax=Desertivirga xinjiangensis TaxID=539206 RepID=UPI00210CA026|nr:DUF1629 domain-containing protein [Pedobacter xinjiangensis]
MKYFRLKRSSNDAQIGTFPQVSEGVFFTTINDPAFLENIDLFKEIQGNVSVPAAKLAKKAKKTDLVSVSSMGFSGRLFVSNKLKNILGKYAADKVQFLESYLLDKTGEKETYWIVQPLTSDQSYLDFENSDIWLKSIREGKISKVPLTSLEDFNIQSQKIDLPKHLQIEKPAIREEILDDFFILQKVSAGTGYYVSEKLKSEIENQNCTGIDFELLHS